MNCGLSFKEHANCGSSFKISRRVVSCRVVVLFLLSFIPPPTRAPWSSCRRQLDSAQQATQPLRFRIRSPEASPRACPLRRHGAGRRAAAWARTDWRALLFLAFVSNPRPEILLSLHHYLNRSLHFLVVRLISRRFVSV